MLARCLFIKFDTHSGLVPDIYETVTDDWVGKTFNNVVPPLRTSRRILEGDVVFRQGRRNLNEGRKTDETVGRAVRRHQDSVEIRVFRNPLQFGYTANVVRVGAR